MQNFRRAKFEWRPKFTPGHWALGLQRLPLLRFHLRAWLCRAGGGWCRAVGRGLLDTPRTSAGRPVSGPYEKEGPASRSAVGAGVLTRPPDFRQGSYKAVGATLAVARHEEIVPTGRGGTPGRPSLLTAQLEPHRKQRRFQTGECQALDYCPVSGSERREIVCRLICPRLCDNEVSA